MVLVSPGVEVNVIDESQHAITDVRDTIPFIILATHQDKNTPDATAIAQATTKAEAGELKLITSPRELVQQFGNPVFYDVNGLVQQNNELNEVGLLAAYKALNVTNRVYVMRADLDLNELNPQPTEPRSDPDTGTYWFDYETTEFGIFELDEGVWVNRQPKLLNNSDRVSGGVPVNSFGNNGDYGVVVVNDNNTDGVISYYQKLNNTWVKLGSSAWDSSTPTVARSTTPFSSPSSQTLAGLPVAGDTIIFDVNSSGSPDNITLTTTVDGTSTLVTSNTLGLDTVILNSTSVTLGTSSAGNLTSQDFASDTTAVTGLNIGDVLRITDTAGTDDISMQIDVEGSGFNATGLAGSFTVNGVLVDLTGVASVGDLDNAIDAALATDPQGIVATNNGTEVTLTKTSNVTGENNPNQIVIDVSGVTGGDTGLSTGTTNLSVQEAADSINNQVTNTDNITASVTGGGPFNLEIDDSATGFQVFSQLGDPVGDFGFASATSVPLADIETEIEAAVANVEVDDTAGTDVPTAGNRLRLIYSGTGDFTIGSGTANTELGFTANTYRVSLNSFIAQFNAAVSFVNTTATIDTNEGSSFVEITNTDSFTMDISGTGSSKLGFPASISTSTLFFASHTNVPSNPEEGDIWIKTTTPNLGANYIVRLFTDGQFAEIDAPMYETNIAAFDGFGTALQEGSLYVRYDNFGTGEADFKIRRFNGASVLELTESDFNGSSGANIQISNGRASLASVAVDSASTFVSAVNGLGQANLEAEVSSGNVIIRNTIGEDIVLADGSAAVAAILPTLGAGTFSNWIPFEGSGVSTSARVGFISSNTAPTDVPEEGTLWYDASVSTDSIDLLINNDSTDQWITFTGDIQISATRPSTRTNGNTLQVGDIWIDSSNFDDFPILRRWTIATGGKWVNIDNTDQTTVNGIIFADARPDADSNLDPDAPNPLLYPAGMLLWNTRASSLVVKEWRGDWFNDDTSPGENFNDTDYTLVSYEIGNDTFSALNSAGRWVTVSGNRLDGSPYMGRKAQRIMLVRGMASVISTNEDVRDLRRNFFNIMMSPGYIELYDEMVSLNIDRKETAFIITDTPKDLLNNSTLIQDWVTNADNAASNSEDGLTTRYTYSAIYYPPVGLTTNLDGSEVATPSSVGALYAYLYNDNVAFPWFPPAGVNRGLLSGVFASVGAINAEEEYQPLQISRGLQDTLYTNNVNPIVFTPQRGLYVNGQKTLSPSASALDRVNVARLIVYLRYQLELLAEEFLFEINDQITRDSVKDTFDRFFADLMSLRAIQDFLIVCDESNNTPERIDRNELWIDIAIQPAKAIEFIFIPIRVKNTGEDLTA